MKLWNINYLSFVPVTFEDNSQVLNVGDEDDDEPDEEEAGALPLGAVDEQQGASEGDEEVKENLVDINIIWKLTLEQLCCQKQVLTPENNVIMDSILQYW